VCQNKFHRKLIIKLENEKSVNSNINVNGLKFVNNKFGFSKIKGTEHDPNAVIFRKCPHCDFMGNNRDKTFDSDYNKDNPNYQGGYGGCWQITCINCNGHFCWDSD